MQSATQFIDSVNVLSFEEFIKANPYPSFETMEDLQSSRLDLDSEYSIDNHNRCKKVYETIYLPDRKKYIDEFIVFVKNIGGSQTLKYNLQTLYLFSPISKIIDPEHIKITNEMYYYILSHL
jgi:hypothetical protein